MYAPYVQLAINPDNLPSRLRSRHETTLGAANKAAWPEGAVFLMSEATGQPIPEVLRFLRHHFLSRLDGKPRKSLNSVSASVHDLSDYYCFLDAHGLNALSVRVTHVENYIHSMALLPSPVTGRPFSERTIARRISTLRQFYGWAGKRGLTKHPIPVDTRSRTDPDGLWFRESGQLYSPRTPRVDIKVTAIPVDKLRLILEEAGPLVEEVTESSGESGRLRLMFDCGLQAGLRRFEISLLTVRSIEAGIKATSSDNPVTKCPIKVYGKGGKTRTVYFPLWFTRLLVQYIAGHRRRAIEARLRIEPNFRDHGYLFVHDAVGRKTSGDAFDDFYLSGPMRAIQIKLGINAGISESSEPYKRLYGVHALRHTYAVHEYITAKLSGDPEPWKYLQMQLGHASVETTRQIYLASVIEYEFQFGDLIQKEIAAVRAQHG